MATWLVGMNVGVTVLGATVGKMLGDGDLKELCLVGFGLGNNEMGCEVGAKVGLFEASVGSTLGSTGSEIIENLELPAAS